MNEAIITIVEVGPRDGLQNITPWIPTEIKLKFIQTLIDAGLSRIETTSFVSHKSIPQLRDATSLSKQLPTEHYHKFECLIPNVRGYHAAIAFPYQRLSFFTTPSEQFCQTNIGCSVAKSLNRLQTILELQPSAKLRVYLSCIWGCPYQGELKESVILTIIEQLTAMGIEEISLGDTIGVASTQTARQRLTAIRQSFGTELFAVHFHDTQDQAINNIDVALNLGFKIIDASAGGLGGCPYAPGAKGNIATEKVNDYLIGQGVDTKIDSKIVKQAAKIISDNIPK